MTTEVNMICTTTLVMALDFKKNKKARHKVSTFKDKHGTWHICKTGPGYSNIYRVIEFDAEAEARLIALQAEKPA
jgi:hypothetical protein